MLFNIGKNRLKHIDLSYDFSCIIGYFKDCNVVNMYRKYTNDYECKEEDCVCRNVLVTFKERKICLGEYIFDLYYSPYSKIDVYLNKKYIIIQLPKGYDGDSVYYYIERCHE